MLLIIDIFIIWTTMTSIIVCNVSCAFEDNILVTKYHPTLSNWLIANSFPSGQQLLVFTKDKRCRRWIKKGENRCRWLWPEYLTLGTGLTYIVELSMKLLPQLTSHKILKMVREIIVIEKGNYFSFRCLCSLNRIVIPHCRVKSAISLFFKK